MSARIDSIKIDDAMTLAVHTFTSGRPGPTVAVLGGVHGDELEGVAAARLIAHRIDGPLTAGSVKIVAVSNPSAFAARTRRNPTDDRDLARSFPGQVDGSATERIAAALTNRVIGGADLLIDLHSAGSAYAMPFFVGARASDGDVDRRSERAARAFGAPLLWLHDEIGPGRSVSTALDLGVPAIYVEGGGGASLSRRDVQGYVHGIENVLADVRMCEQPRRTSVVPSVIRGGDGDVDVSLSAPVSGWCITAVGAGDEVVQGEPLAEIIDESGDTVARLTAPRAGTVMMMRRHAEVFAGDGIAMLGPLAEAPA